MTAKIIPFEVKEPICSFCRKPKSKVPEKKLVHGILGGYICTTCLETCTKLKNEN